MRVPAAPTKPRTAKMTSYAAPVGGWVSNRNLAQPNQYGTQPGAAVLDNWFPTATCAILRRGSDVYATVGGGTANVDSVFSYVNGITQKLFAATPTTVYDITDSAAITTAVPTQTSGNWSVVQFATSGGVFLRLVNGSDTPQVFNGTTWGTTPAITFTDGTLASQLNNVWASKNRLWFVKKDSLTAYYLPVDSIGGAAVAFPLGGVFTRGGSLLFGASWSIETLGGIDERNVFFSTEGEAAVYQGTDPSNASAWSLVGVYRIGRPLGPKAWIHAGGDLVIATDIGFVPLSQAMQRDYAALSPSAVSYPIETAWNDAVEARSGNWDCIVWPTNQMVIVAPPSSSDLLDEVFAANVRTGAWGRFTAWNARCLALYNQRLFFGSTNGKIIEGNVGGTDQGAPYTGVYLPLFTDLKSPGSAKIARMARAVLRDGIPVNDQLTINVDFDTSPPAAPDATPTAGVDAWDTAIWGTAVWGTSQTIATQQIWRSAGAVGYTLAPCLQITSGSTVPLDTQLVRVDMAYDVADIIT